MNIHPIFVHFPIALLVFYSALEIVQLQPRLRRLTFLTNTKVFLLLAGTVFAFITLQTGELAEHAAGFTRSNRQYVEMHSTFANATSYLFLSISIIYLLRFASRHERFQTMNGAIQKIVLLILKIFDRPWILGVLAVLGFVGIMVTGALGGGLVYGPALDPFVHFVYKILFHIP